MARLDRATQQALVRAPKESWSTKTIKKYKRTKTIFGARRAPNTSL
jgi:hypothetical protein